MCMYHPRGFLLLSVKLYWFVSPPQQVDGVFSLSGDSSSTDARSDPKGTQCRPRHASLKPQNTHTHSWRDMSINTVALYTHTFKMVSDYRSLRPVRPSQQLKEEANPGPWLLNPDHFCHVRGLQIWSKTSQTAGRLIEVIPIISNLFDQTRLNIIPNNLMFMV